MEIATEVYWEVVNKKWSWILKILTWEDIGVNSQKRVISEIEFS